MSAPAESGTVENYVARYAIVGSPVIHSLSPLVQQAAFRAAGISATYEIVEADERTGADAFSNLYAMGYAGWNVTTPLKELAARLVHHKSDTASALSAVNTVRVSDDAELEGENTDGAGFVRAVRELWSFDPCGADVLILGSGPAARAVANALSHAGAQLSCWSRNEERAKALAPAPVSQPVMVVSAIPVDAVVPQHIIDLASDETMIFDLNYGRPGSPVFQMKGRRRSDGLPMLLHQGALAFEWWTGTPAPLEAMRRALSQ